jgi:putative tributyrin esterase
MKRTLHLCALLILVFNAPASAQHRQPVETIKLKSDLVGKTLPYNVILPRDYDISRTTRYPVLFLLHGLFGHYSDWLTKTNVADYAAQYRIIIVMPEGNNGWYTDSATTPADKYETYILKELIPDVQKRYRTIETRYGRGVAGLSMGGYGALKFGLKFPDTFVFAASMSGALAAPNWTEDDLKALKAIRDSVFNVFGPINSETRRANDIYEMARGLSAARVAGLPYFYLDCGTEDLLAAYNQQFATILRDKKIPHEYRELPGDHNWAFWDRQVQEVLRLASEKLHAGRITPVVTPVRRKPAKRHKLAARSGLRYSFSVRQTSFSKRHEKRIAEFRHSNCA